MRDVCADLAQSTMTDSALAQSLPRQSLPMTWSDACYRRLQRADGIECRSESEMEQLLQTFVEGFTDASGESYDVQVYGRSRPADTWQAWIVFTRRSDGRTS